MELLTAAGTLGRRTGVYFKLKRSPQTALEGDRTFSVILEVPESWRGDLVEVTTEAYSQDGSRTKRIAHARYIMAIYVEGDAVAAQVSNGYVRMEQHLRRVASHHAHEIDRRSHPTPLHRIAGALEFLEPQIPSQWLSETIFGHQGMYPSGDYQRLPVDVRVAILDYLDQKQAMETLATSKTEFASRTNELAKSP
jgi:hypothetical protein